ncbi:hypothetical protein GGR56DRAFT_680602 [Xylariaceae sp. FL0804]|nr:hypothetical protein GGR56DRAFT_680602 [Xylariaceae sp. FL0804]
MARPESTESTIDIAQIEKSFPAPPRSSHSNRKTLPPLPPIAEIQREAKLATPKSKFNDGTIHGVDFRNLSPAVGGPAKELPLPFGITISTAGAPRAMPKDYPQRPMTASTKRLSFSSRVSQRRVKYGTGKYANVELSPQPSDDPEDPLNWPRWKKELNFYALLLMTALVGALKTAFVSVNDAVAADGRVSYTAAASLTAVPLMLSAATGMASNVQARIRGKRPLYLVSAALLFVGAAVDTTARQSFGQNVVARIFQGLGWGAFDTLVLGSINDTYFKHERDIKIQILYVTSVAATWGSPLLGGVASSGRAGFDVQFDIIISFLLVVAIPLLVFGAPETTFDRPRNDDYYSSFSSGRPTSSITSTSTGTGTGRSPSSSSLQRPRTTTNREALLGLLREGARFWPYRAAYGGVDAALLAQAPRAAAAPSVLLLLAATALPHAALWGLAGTLARLMGALLSPADVGALMTGPFLFATAVAVAGFFYFRGGRRGGGGGQQKQQGVVGVGGLGLSRGARVAVLAAASALALVGVIGFGAYVGAPRPAGDVFYVAGLSLPAVSVLLGLVAAGSLGLDAAIRPVLAQAAVGAVQGGSSALDNEKDDEEDKDDAEAEAEAARAERVAADMHAGLAGARALAAGVFAVAVPAAVDVRAAALGLGITHIFVATAVGAVWWYRAEDVRRLDGRVLGLADLAAVKRAGSFFNTD